MTRALHEMSRAEIVAMLEKDTASPTARRFLMELYDCADPSEIPDLLVSLSLLAEALKDKPVDFDTMSLSFRELGPLLGYGPDLPVIPGVDPALYDGPLHAFAAVMGPATFRYHLSEFERKLDADHERRCEALGEQYRFPD
jgi:hypothetical protein